MLTPELLRHRGFKESEPRIWDTDRITLGELCDLIGSAPDQFAFTNNSNMAFEFGPMVYDVGQAVAVVHHLSADTLTDEGMRSRATPVKASVIVYDDAHPRPKTKIVLNRDGKPNSVQVP